MIRKFIIKIKTEGGVMNKKKELRKIEAWLKATAKFRNKARGGIETFCWDQVSISLTEVINLLLKEEKKLGSIHSEVIASKFASILACAKSNGRIETVCGIFLLSLGNRDRRSKFIRGILIKLSEIFIMRIQDLLNLL